MIAKSISHIRYSRPKSGIDEPDITAVIIEPRHLLDPSPAHPITKSRQNLILCRLMEI